MAVHGQRRMQDSATSRIRRLASRGRDHHSFVPYLRATPGQRAMAADLRQAGHRERQAPGHSARPRTARPMMRPIFQGGRHHPLLSTARLGEQPLATGDGACRDTYIYPRADAVATRKTQGAADCCSGSQSPARLALAGPSSAAASLPGLTWQADAPAPMPQTGSSAGPGARHGHARAADRQPRTLLAEGRRAGKPVTESEEPPIWRQVASADMVYEPRPNGLILFRRRVPILSSDHTCSHGSRVHTVASGERHERRWPKQVITDRYHC